MRSYTEMDRRRKRARPLYLELRALGLEVCAEGDGDCPTGYRIVVGGFKSLSPAHADCIKCPVFWKTRRDSRRSS